MPGGTRGRCQGSEEGTGWVPPVQQGTSAWRGPTEGRDLGASLALRELLTPARSHTLSRWAAPIPGQDGPFGEPLDQPSAPPSLPAHVCWGSQLLLCPLPPWHLPQTQGTPCPLPQHREQSSPGGLTAFGRRGKVPWEESPSPGQPPQQQLPHSWAGRGTTGGKCSTEGLWGSLS